MMDTSAWKAPGGGYWQRDMTHVAGTVTRYLAHAIQQMFAGLAQGWAEYGVPLSGFDTALVGGRLYGRVRPVAAPDPDRARGRPSGPPPAWLMKVLWALHPELRRRRRRAGETLRLRRWRLDAAQWAASHQPAARARNRALQAVDPGMLDDRALADHIEAIDRAFLEGFWRHGRLICTHSLPVGLWLVATSEWTGATPAEALAALRGTSPASIATVAAIARIARAAQAVPAATTALADRQSHPVDRLARLRASSPDVARVLDEYLEEHGNRLVTGFELYDRTMREMPEIVVDSIAASLGEEPAARGDHEGDAARLRDRVPAPSRSEYDALLADARAHFGIRDEGVGLLAHWPQGLLRLALLEAGRRLQRAGRVGEPEDLFDTIPGEVPGLLRGSAEPSAPELARRVTERRSFETADPPVSFGTGAPPPVDAFPRDVAIITRALMAVQSFDAGDRPIARAEPGVLRGTGVSAGRFEGRARIVLGPLDFTKIQKGDVLVAPTTCPSYNVLLPLLGAVVTDRGGLLCHAAIVAREFGIPGVVGTDTATTRIPDGARVVVDGDRGEVTVSP